MPCEGEKKGGKTMSSLNTEKTSFAGEWLGLLWSGSIFECGEKAGTYVLLNGDMSANAYFRAGVVCGVPKNL